MRMHSSGFFMPDYNYNEVVDFTNIEGIKLTAEEIENIGKIA